MLGWSWHTTYFLAVLLVLNNSHIYKRAKNELKRYPGQLNRMRWTAVCVCVCACLERSQFHNIGSNSRGRTFQNSVDLIPLIVLYIFILSARLFYRSHSMLWPMPIYGIERHSTTNGTERNQRIEATQKKEIIKTSASPITTPHHFNCTLNEI